MDVIYYAMQHIIIIHDPARFLFPPFFFFCILIKLMKILMIYSTLPKVTKSKFWPNSITLEEIQSEPQAVAQAVPEWWKAQQAGMQ